MTYNYRYSLLSRFYELSRTTFLSSYIIKSAVSPRGKILQEIIKRTAKKAIPKPPLKKAIPKPPPPKAMPKPPPPTGLARAKAGLGDVVGGLGQAAARGASNLISGGRRIAGNKAFRRGLAGGLIGGGLGDALNNSNTNPSLHDVLPYLPDNPLNPSILPRMLPSPLINGSEEDPQQIEPEVYDAEDNQTVLPKTYSM